MWSSWVSGLKALLFQLNYNLHCLWLTTYILDPLEGTKQQVQATEGQAIGRAHRQGNFILIISTVLKIFSGQTNPVTLVRFIIHDTLEHELYIQVNGPTGKCILVPTIDSNCSPCAPAKDKGNVTIIHGNKSAKPKIVRSNSVSTLLAIQSPLKRTSSLARFLDSNDSLN